MISWGIIGCGNVTEVKSGPAFNKVPNSRLVAIMRRNAAKAQDYAQRHHVARWYSDATQLINDPEVTAIYIATPPLSHEEYAAQALKAGKQVYLEKPMAIDAAAAARIAAIAAQTGTKLCVAHYRRQQPLFLKIKSLLEANAIGAVRFVNLQFLQPFQSPMIAQTDEAWRLNPAISGGGLFHDLAPHQLDLMLYFFGKPVQASGHSFNTAGLYEADDTTAGQILFESGIIFSGTWCFTMAENSDRVEITGTEGSITFSVFAHQPLSLIKNGHTTVFEFDVLQHVQQPMIEQVVAYFNDEAPNPCTANEGVMVMRMMEGFTSKAVVFE